IAGSSIEWRPTSSLSRAIRTSNGSRAISRTMKRTKSAGLAPMPSNPNGRPSRSSAGPELGPQKGEARLAFKRNSHAFLHPPTLTPRSEPAIKAPDAEPEPDRKGATGRFFDEIRSRGRACARKLDHGSGSGERRPSRKGEG